MLLRCSQRERGILAPVFWYNEGMLETFLREMVVESVALDGVLKQAQDDGQKKRVAVLFSGGPASGGHNVVWGLFEALRGNTLFGVKAGPGGLLKGDLFEITETALSRVKNLGGFDFLGTDRTKIKSDEQLETVKRVVAEYCLDAIVVVGGDDSNTNAFVLAEFLKDVGCVVVGVPKTIDGDLQVPGKLPISFGFDTATKIYSEMVGNILQDTRSSLKYWHFIKLMGRSASHVTLEVGLQTQPAVTLISEEIREKKMSLEDVVAYVSGIVEDRASRGIKHGVVLVPEGLVEFIPGLVESLPDEFQARDSHGNLQVSQIETEKLLAKLVAEKTGCSTQTHFFGYEGRCGAPTKFDAWLTFNLGRVAGQLVLEEKTGYMAALNSFESGGMAQEVDLGDLITTEMRDGKKVSVIEKALVKTDSPAFKYFDQRRGDWAREDLFLSPGPRQYFGALGEVIAPLMVGLNEGYIS